MSVWSSSRLAESVWVKPGSYISLKKAKEAEMLAKARGELVPGTEEAVSLVPEIDITERSGVTHVLVGDRLRYGLDHPFTQMGPHEVIVRGVVSNGWFFRWRLQRCVDRLIRKYALQKAIMLAPAAVVG